MKFLAILKFEFFYQLKRASIWINLLGMLLLASLLALSFLDDARKGEITLNSPLAVGAMYAFATIFALPLLASLAGDAVMRDAEARMEPLVFTSPITKLNFLSGRFISSVLISLISTVLVVPLSLIVFINFPGSDVKYLGTPDLVAYADACLIIVLPNMLIAVSIMYATAVFSRSSLMTYVVCLLLFICTITSMDILAGHLAKWELAKLLDYSGFTILKAIRKSTPPANLITVNISLTDFFLNRVVWMSGALVTGLASFFYFDFKKVKTRKWWWSSKRIHDTESTSFSFGNYSRISGTFNLTSSARQTFELAWKCYSEVVLGWTGIALLFMTGILFHVAEELLEGPLGVPLIPTTAMIMKVFNNPSLTLLVTGFVLLFVTQTMWRERDQRISDLMDAWPISDTVMLTAKILALFFFIFSVQLLLMVAGLSLQTFLSYADFNLVLYLQWLMGIHFVDYLIFGIAAMFIHVIVNQKHAAFIISVLFFAYCTFPSLFGIEHKMLIFSSDPGIEHTEMNGFDSSWLAWISFKIYWMSCAMLLIVLSKILWTRGRDTALIKRIRTSVFELRAGQLLALTLVGVMFLSTGGFVWYNTNIINSYQNSGERTHHAAMYEKNFRKYMTLPQPDITDIQLHVELYPDSRSLTITGQYTLVNKTPAPVTTLLFASSENAVTRFDQNQIFDSIDFHDQFDFLIGKLKDPLATGDSIKFDFNVRIDAPGFSNSGSLPPVAENGTFLMMIEWLPLVGYQSDRELANEALRMEHGLQPKRKIPALNDTTAQKTDRGRGAVSFNVLIGTSKDQTAITAGTLKDSWEKDGRRYFRYTSDNQFPNGLAILSARYDVYEKEWKNKKLQIFYHPEHQHNKDRMMESMVASLEYHEENFSGYPHEYLKLVEYPGAGPLTSLAGMIVYPGEFAMMDPDRDLRGFDLPFSVVAHEVAHQWWGNQLVPAFVEGAPLLTESLAWYTALGVVETNKGKQHKQSLLEVMHDAYLTPRTKAGVSLLRGFDKFLGYRKGPFAMEALRQFVGEDSVNAALRKMIQKFPLQKEQKPLSLDLYEELSNVTPDSLRNFLHDLVAANVFWKLKTEKAVVVEQAPQQWSISLDILAEKTEVDSVGNEKRLPLDEYIEVGVYAMDGVTPIYLRRHRISDEKQTIQIVVNQKPGIAGIDPRLLMIDTDPYDNMLSIVNAGTE